MKMPKYYLTLQHKGERALDPEGHKIHDVEIETDSRLSLLEAAEEIFKSHLKDSITQMTFVERPGSGGKNFTAGVYTTHGRSAYTISIEVEDKERVVVVEHAHGTDVRLGTEEQCINFVHEYVKEYWEEEFGPVPKDRTQAISKYFESVNYGWWHLSAVNRLS